MFHTSPSDARSPLDHYLQELHAKHRDLAEGQVADYIPELAKANPSLFGICIATRDGHVYEVGDTRRGFTIQSISKALAYGLALEDRGEDYILSRISVEPSGDAFNAISLKADSGAPFNPMINAGAIATCGQVLAKEGKSRIQRIISYLSACAGRTLSIDQAVYESESATGHRNRAIGWMLRNFDIIEEEPTDTLETYFQQCAIEVTCRDLAIIAATLANHGRNPLTQEQAIAPEYVDNILSVMSSCGMYDFSGEWLYRIGLPAKSGVGGGILAVLPGQLGIGIFSPPLDAQGNSARGIKVCADLSRDLNLHVFATGSAPPSALRLSYDGSQVSSRQRRPAKLQQTLRTSGHRIRVMELQGQLVFSTFEPIMRHALKQAPYCQYIILNLRNVVSVDSVASSLISELQKSLLNKGVCLVACYLARFSSAFMQQGFAQDQIFPDTDTALEYCETGLLDKLEGQGWNVSKDVTLSDTYLLQGLPADDITWLESKMEHRTANRGELVIQANEPGDRLYLLLSGLVEVRLQSENGKPGKRIEVLVAGMSFGEMGLIDGSPRSADVIAIEPLELRVIDKNLFERLDIERPGLKIKLLAKIANQLSVNLRRTNAELAAFKS